MNRLSTARRAEVVRDEKQVAGRDELLRLHIVATLVLQGTGREVEGASQCGSLVQPKDLEHEFIPPVAILLGRSSDGSDGPALLRTGAALSDPESKEAGCVVAILLSALVAYRRQRSAGRVCSRCRSPT